MASLARSPPPLTIITNLIASQTPRVTLMADKAANQANKSDRTTPQATPPSMSAAITPRRGQDRRHDQDRNQKPNQNHASEPATIPRRDETWVPATPRPGETRAITSGRRGNVGARVHGHCGSGIVITADEAHDDHAGRREAWPR